MRNLHERELAVPADRVGFWLDRLGSEEDRLWPAPHWQPMIMDRPIQVGARGGHGNIRYNVSAHEPGRRVEFTFEPGRGLEGVHAFSVSELGPDRCMIKYEANAVVSASGAVPSWLGKIIWSLLVLPVHNAVIEDIFDRTELAVGLRAEWRPDWPPLVRVLHRLMEVPAARPTGVPDTELVRTALPRTDWTDAYEIQRWRGMPADPHDWSDAIFKSPPAWVAGFLGLRQVLVGLIGMKPAPSTAFDPIATEGNEVLLGIDDDHLDFRAVVSVEANRVVVSTLVSINNRRGGAYSAVIRRFHPLIVRSMMRSAARSFTVAPVTAESQV